MIPAEQKASARKFVERWQKAEGKPMMHPFSIYADATQAPLGAE